MIAPERRRVHLPATVIARPITINLLRQTIARLYLAAEAMGVTVDEIDIDLAEFPDEARARWLALSDEWIRRFVNGEIQG